MRCYRAAWLVLLPIISVLSVAAAANEWPGFRGPAASGVADGAALPERWNVNTGENIRWKVAVPGLAHSSPVVWGDRVFLATAISTRADVTFKPGLYGEGTASEDRSPQRWVVLALDRRTGQTVWQQTAYEGTPREKRHIKATYANATPVTDGRYVVAFFGSQGLYAFDMAGKPAWKKDLGVLNTGAYDLPEYSGDRQLADDLQRPGDRPVRHAERLIPAGIGHQDGKDRLEDRAHGAAVVGTPTVVPARGGVRRRS